MPGVKGVAGTAEGIGGQGKLLVIDHRLIGHAARAAVGPVVHGIGVGHPPGIDGLAGGHDHVFLANGSGVVLVVVPFGTIVAGAGVLLKKHLRLHRKVRNIGQGQAVQRVVGRYKAVALQHRVVAHIQLGQPVVVDVQKPQLFQHRGVKLGQLVVKGLNKHQLQVMAHVQRRQEVVPAVQLLQLRVAGQIQRGQLVALTVQVDEFSAAGHIQRREEVGGAVQIPQPGIGPHIQRRQPVVAHIQRFQRGKVLNTGQIGNVLAGQIQFGHRRQFFGGQATVRPRAVQVGRICQPGAEIRVGEVLRADLQVCACRQHARRQQGQRQQRRRQHRTEGFVQVSHG